MSDRGRGGIVKANKILIMGSLLFFPFSFSSEELRASTLPQSDKNVIFSISLQPGSTISSDSVCETLRTAAFYWHIGTMADAQCVLLTPGEKSNSRLEEASRSDRYLYHIQFSELQDGRKLVSVDNWAKLDETDFTRTSWKIESNGDWSLTTQRLLEKFFDFHMRKQGLRRSLLDAGLDNSKRLQRRGQGYYDTITRSDIDFDTAYAIYRDENNKQKYFLVMGVEIAVMLGVATWNYYAHPGGNVRDWQYDTSGSIRARLNGSAVRFDDNAFDINRDHLFAGMMYYVGARSNNMNRLESFLFTFAASSTWEFISEYREVVSINDEITTTVGGFVLGEVLHSMGKAFAHGPNTAGNRILRAVFGTPERFNAWAANDRDRKPIFDLTSSGFDPEIWSKFDLTLTREERESTIYALGINSEVIDIPMFEEPGQARALLTDTIFSQMVINKMTNGPDSVNQFYLFAKATLAGYYAKNLGRDDKGRLTGYNFFVGPSSALEISQRKGFDVKADHYAQVHVLGSTIDLTVYMKGLKIRSTIDVYGDFALMRSYAIDEYLATVADTSGIPNTLVRDRYYYGTGTTGKLTASASYGRIEIGASYSGSSARMIHARDRNAQTVTYDRDTRDEVTDTQTWVTFSVTDNTKIQFGVQRIDRSGSIQDFGSYADTEIRNMATLLYSFR